MSKHDESNIDEFSYNDEISMEPVVQRGPTPEHVPTVGSIDQVLSRISHCDVCGGRLHFNYVSDFSRNTTHEKSSCPECNLDTRQVMHRLQ